MWRWRESRIAIERKAPKWRRRRGHAKNTLSATVHTETTKCVAFFHSIDINDKCFILWTHEININHAIFRRISRYFLCIFIQYFLPLLFSLSSSSTISSACSRAMCYTSNGRTCTKRTKLYIKCHFNYTNNFPTKYPSKRNKNVFFFG